MGGILAILWIAVPVLVMASAAAADIRTREVPDAHWAVMGVAGSVICASACIGDAGPVPSVCHLAASLFLLVYMLSERLSGWAAVPVLVPAVVLALVPAVSLDSEYSIASLASLVMFMLFAGMYRAGILRGGADAKCLMTVALVFPVAPEAEAFPLLWSAPYPESLVLNPSASVFIVALVLSLLSCLCVAARNLRDGRVCRRMLTSYETDLDDARAAFVWPVECADRGRRVPCGTCYEKDAVLDGLESIGESRVAVTPMLPFVLPVAVSLLVIAVLGSPLVPLLSV